MAKQDIREHAVFIVKQLEFVIMIVYELELFEKY